MIGMNTITGHAIEGDEHLVQCIRDILTTPIGTRVMRRSYGSLLPELIDQPANGATTLKLYGATATALMRWLPMLVIKRVQLFPGATTGAYELDLEGQRTDTPLGNDSLRLTIPLSFRST